MIAVQVHEDPTKVHPPSGSRGKRPWHTTRPGRSGSTCPATAARARSGRVDLRAAASPAGASDVVLERHRDPRVSRGAPRSRRASPRLKATVGYSGDERAGLRGPPAGLDPDECARAETARYASHSAVSVAQGGPPRPLPTPVHRGRAGREAEWTGRRAGRRNREGKPVEAGSDFTSLNSRSRAPGRCQLHRRVVGLGPGAK